MRYAMVRKVMDIAGVLNPMGEYRWFWPSLAFLQLALIEEGHPSLSSVNSGSTMPILLVAEVVS